MTLPALKTFVQEYQYFEDTGAIDVSLASIIACRLHLGDPVWLVIIGASSGGKSQILRPLSLTDAKFLHRVDDLTENTFLSGMKVGKGAPEPSLLLRIGAKGIIVMSDLTVLFSKNKEARGTILSQFRMLYDGEMTKYSGTSAEPLRWKGYLGVIAGSTPTIYSHFEEVADMGERFIYWRMKDYDALKATRLAMKRGKGGKELDDLLGAAYAEYIKEVVDEWRDKPIELSEEAEERIMRIALFAEKVRTGISMDFQRKEIVRKPVVAMPMRVSLQLKALGRGLAAMNGGVLDEEQIQKLEWCGYSLANEEKRGVLRILAGIPKDRSYSTQIIADTLGLSTGVTGHILQNLSAVGVTERTGSDQGLMWKIRSPEDKELVRRIEGLSKDDVVKDRKISHEEKDEMNKAHDAELEGWGDIK